MNASRQGGASLAGGSTSGPNLQFMIDFVADDRHRTSSRIADSQSLVVASHVSTAGSATKPKQKARVSQGSPGCALWCGEGSAYPRCWGLSRPKRLVQFSERSSLLRLFLPRRLNAYRGLDFERLIRFTERRLARCSQLLMFFPEPCSCISDETSLPSRRFTVRSAQCA